MSLNSAYFICNILITFCSSNTLNNHVGIIYIRLDDLSSDLIYTVK